MKLAFYLADQSRHAPIKQGEFFREEVPGYPKPLWIYQRRWFTSSPEDIQAFNRLADQLLREQDYIVMVIALPTLQATPAPEVEAPSAPSNQATPPASKAPRKTGKIRQTGQVPLPTP